MSGERNKADPGDVQFTTVRLRRDLARKFKAIAALQGVTLTTLLDQILEREINKEICSIIKEEN